LEAQSDIVEMAHTALGHLEELKKKELVLAVMTMSNEEFGQLVAQRNQLIVESAVASGDVSQYSVRYEYLLWARPAKARR